MPARLKYKIEDLEWQQFELLAFKCLQYDVSPSITYMEGGHDRGRDFVYEGITDFFETATTSHSYIFQAKHKSDLASFSSLKRDFLKELEKIYVTNQFKFEIFCLVTNLPLTAGQHDELQAVFNEFKAKGNLDFPLGFQIYSYRHFESCLDNNKRLRVDFPSILHTSDLMTLLEEVVQKEERNRITSWLDVFKKNAPRFVHTNVYESAINSLVSSDVILLSGPPKSGKTFTGEMLAFHMFVNNQYVPYAISDIDQFLEYFDREKKQLFLFDDSFGRHNIELYRADSLNRSFDSILLSLGANHKFVFTSREYIVRDFLNGTESEMFANNVTKVNLAITDWTTSEKESLLRRYFRLEFKREIADVYIENLVKHRNFEPETIRSFFENHPTQFHFSELIDHLNKPDLYLRRFFENLDNDKKVVLLSILLSLKKTERDVAYVFNNLLSDLKIGNLINLSKQLEILQDSITIVRGGVYDFLHPSMFDFFIHLISKDIATYRKLMFENINMELLAMISLTPKKGRFLIVDEIDLPRLQLGLKRIVLNPEVTLLEINSIFAWLSLPELQLKAKTSWRHSFGALKLNFMSSLGDLNLSRIFQNTSIFLVIDFLKNISLEGRRDVIREDLIKAMFNRFRADTNFWNVVFRASSIIKEHRITAFIEREWFTKFESDLKASLDLLGHELFGDAYPEFNELKAYQTAAKDDAAKAWKTFEKKQPSDFIQRTNFDWYPRYSLVKQKIGVIKASHPFGFRIYEKLVPRFEILKRLEYHEKIRYGYKLRNKDWDMLGEYQPRHMDPDEYEIMEDNWYYQEEEESRKKEQEEDDERTRRREEER